MSSSIRHFILFRDIPLMYGRVPKVANSSIKSSLCKLLDKKPDKSIKTTADRFWRQHTQGETQLITTIQARRLRATHFSFSFVRNPFDRLIAAYNNKILEIEDVPKPMKLMGLYHSMPFEEFIYKVCGTESDNLDNHVRPQAEILLAENKIVPKFVGRMEHIDTHWKQLRKRMKLEGLPPLGLLPHKNVRRNNKKDIADYFKKSELVDLVLARYAVDFKRFYGPYNVDQLLFGDQLALEQPLQRGLAKAKQRFRSLSSNQIESINA